MALHQQQHPEDHFLESSPSTFPSFTEIPSTIDSGETDSQIGTVCEEHPLTIEKDSIFRDPSMASITI